MVWRWIIRGVFLLALAIVVGVWVGSYWRHVGVGYIGGQHSRSLGVASGWVIFSDFDDSGYVGNEWSWSSQRANLEPVAVAYLSGKYHFAGFGFRQTGGSLRGWHVFVPLWCPATISALLLWLGWRKTRAKSVGGAFPMEFAKGPADAK